MRMRLVAAMLVASLSVSSVADAKGWRTSARHRRQRAERAAEAAAAAAAYATWYASLNARDRAVENRRQDLHAQANALRARAQEIRWQAWEDQRMACQKSWFGTNCPY